MQASALGLTVLIITFGACEGKAIVVSPPRVRKLNALPIVVRQGKDSGQGDDATNEDLQDIAAAQPVHMAHSCSMIRHFVQDQQACALLKLLEMLTTPIVADGLSCGLMQ